MMKAMMTLALAAGISLAATADVKLSDTFVDGSHWDVGQQWRITDDGKMCGSCNSGTILRLKDKTESTSLTFSAEVTPAEAKSQGWKTCGLAVCHDMKNYWALNLVETPDKDGKKHFVELSQMRNGAWNSQGNLSKTAKIAPGFTWKYGETYRFKIMLTPEGITGQITDMAGKMLANISYKFSGEAVKAGCAGLRVTGMTVNFDNVEIEGK